MAAVSSELIAVTLVIESSMVVYDDFYQRPLPHNSNPTGPPLVRYLSEIFKRLTAVHRKAQFRIAYVTYGPPDHYPSPLVRKQYFAYYRHVTETLGKEPEGGRVMGIGSTSAVESIGMAALDGLVAAVEMFDDLTESLGDAFPERVQHIVHVASTPPDDTIHPLYNDDPELDDVTWGDLHEAFHKRNINYNLITLKPLETFNRLYRSAITTSKATPTSIPTLGRHDVYLCGVPPASTQIQQQPPAQTAAAAASAVPTPPQQQQKTTATTKRPNESAVDRQAEAKRAKLTDTTATTTAATAAAPEPPALPKPTAVPKPTAPSPKVPPLTAAPALQNAGTSTPPNPGMSASTSSGGGVGGGSNNNNNVPKGMVPPVSGPSNLNTITPNPASAPTASASATAAAAGAPGAPTASGSGSAPGPGPASIAPTLVGLAQAVGMAPEGYLRSMLERAKMAENQIVQLRDKAKEAKEAGNEAVCRALVAEMFEKTQKLQTFKQQLGQLMHNSKVVAANASANVNVNAVASGSGSGAGAGAAGSAHQQQQQGQGKAGQGGQGQGVVPMQGVQPTRSESAMGMGMQQPQPQPQPGNFSSPGNMGPGDAFHLAMSNPAAAAAAQQQQQQQQQQQHQQQQQQKAAVAAAQMSMNQNSNSMNPMMSAQAQVQQHLMHQRTLSQQGQSASPVNAAAFLAGMGGMGGAAGGVGGSQASAGALGGMVGPAASPELTMQFQKLMDQRNRIQQGGGAAGAGAGAGGMSMGGVGGVGQQQQQQTPQLPNFGMPMGMGMQGQQQQQAQQQQQHQQQQQQPSGTRNTVSHVWSGYMKWEGAGADQVTRNMSCIVSAATPEPEKCLSHTWPPHLTMVPAATPAKSWEQIKAWIAVHRPGIAQITAGKMGSQDSDPRNHMQFQAFLNMLKRDDGMYATASWTTPTGHQGVNAVFFHNQQNDVMMGAFFPVTGAPELPHMVPVPISTGRHMSLEEAIVVFKKALNTMPEAQRAGLMSRITDPAVNSVERNQAIVGFAQKFREREQMAAVQAQQAAAAASSSSSSGGVQGGVGGGGVNALMAGFPGVAGQAGMAAMAANRNAAAAAAMMMNNNTQGGVPGGGGPGGGSNNHFAMAAAMHAGMTGAMGGMMAPPPPGQHGLGPSQ